MKFYWRILINLILTLYSAICILPLLLVLAVSFTDEGVLALNGYSFIPGKFSLSAYRFIFSEGGKVLSAYGITFLVTILGTIGALIIISMYAYAMSRKDFKYSGFFTVYAVITMLFSGGLVPWYLVCSQLLHLKDNIFALIVPYMVNAYFMIIMRSFFRSSVPDSIIESAKLDGAGEFKIFFSIITRIALPGFATIGLFLALQYWNDWWLPMMLIDNPKLINLQYLMYKMLNNLTFLSSGLVKTGDAAGEIAKMPSESARMAMAVLAVGPIILFSSFFQKFFVKGLTLGAVKG